jgi:hypothetical protein
MSSLNQIESAGRQSGVLTSLQLDNTGALKVTSGGQGNYGNVKTLSTGVGLSLIPSLVNGLTNTGSITLLAASIFSTTGISATLPLMIRQATGTTAGSSAFLSTGSFTGNPIKAFETFSVSPSASVFTYSVDLTNLNITIPLGGVASIASLAIGNGNVQASGALFSSGTVYISYTYNQN